MNPKMVNIHTQLFDFSSEFFSLKPTQLAEPWKIWDIFGCSSLEPGLWTQGSRGRRASASQSKSEGWATSVFV